MGLTQISTDGVKANTLTKDDIASSAITGAELANDAVEDDSIKTSNNVSAGKFLQYKDGMDKLTWAAVPAGVGGANGADFNDNVKSRYGAGYDLSIWSNGSIGIIQGISGGGIHIGDADTEAIIDIEPTQVVFNKNISSQDNDIDIRKSGASKLLWDDSDTAFEFANDVKLTFGGSAGSSGQVLTSGGSGAAPSWAAVPPGGNTVELVADGAIAANKGVQLKTNGKIEEIKETVAESNITAKINNSGVEDDTTTFNYLAYDPTNRYVLHTWQSNESGSEWRNYRLYTINSTGAALSSSGSDQRLVSTTNSQQPKHVRCGFDTNRGKFLIINGKDPSSSNQKTSYVGTVSGSTVTWSNKTVYDTSTQEANKLELIYDTTNNLNIAVYAYYNVGLQCNAGTMNSSGEMTWAGVQTVQSGSGNSIETISAAYDSTTNRIVAIWRYENPNGGARSGKMKVGRKSTSNNTITWGSEIEWHGYGFDNAGLACGNGKVVVVFGDHNDSRKLKYRVGTLSSSDNTVTWGSTTATGLTDHCFNVDLCYQPNIDKFLISYTVSPNGSTQQNGDDSKIAKGEVSGTSITWSNATTYDNDSNRSLNIIPLGGTVGTSFAAFAHVGSAINDSNKNKFYIQHAATATSNQYDGGKRFIGFAPSAISDGATGTVNTDGNTIDNQSGLTAGTRYYLQDSGALGTDTANGSGVSYKGGGLALSATKLLIRYKE